MKKNLLKNSLIRIRGFSLIELSVVVLIVGLLVATTVAGGRKMISLAITNTKSGSLVNGSPVNGTEDLALWLETTSKNSFTTPPVNGTSIATWKDINPQQSLKTDATVSGTQPTYTTGVINGLPALRFNGDSYIDLPSSLLTLPNSSNTTFIVSKADSNTANGYIIFIGNNSTFDGYRFIYNVLDGRVFYNNGTAGSSLSRTDVVKNRWNIFTTYYDAPTTTHAFSVNGDTFTTGSNGSSISTANQATLSHNIVPLSGYIAEIIIFRRKLSDFEITQIQKYLSSKYQIPLV